MRDPTRGGIASVAHEIARACGMGLRLEQGLIPVRDEVASVCEMLGYDPYYLACEGRVVAVLAPDEADAALAAWRALPEGADAQIIGSVTARRTKAHRARHRARRRTLPGRTGRRPAAANLLTPQAGGAPRSLHGQKRSTQGCKARKLQEPTSLASFFLPRRSCLGIRILSSPRGLPRARSEGGDPVIMARVVQPTCPGRARAELEPHDDCPLARIKC